MKRKVSLLLLALILVTTLASGCRIYPKVEAPLESREATTVGTSTASKEEAPYGIRMGKTFIADFYPGAFVDTLTEDDKSEERLYKKGDPTGIIIVNNLDETRHYQLTCGQSTDLEPGYSETPSYVLEEWVRISNPNPILTAREIRLIPVSLWMPPDAETFADKWEFTIYVIDTGQTAFAQIGYGYRWLVEMKQ